MLKVSIRITYTIITISRRKHVASKWELIAPLRIQLFKRSARYVCWNNQILNLPLVCDVINGLCLRMSCACNRQHSADVNVVHIFSVYRDSIFPLVYGV